MSMHNDDGLSLLEKGKNQSHGTSTQSHCSPYVIQPERRHLFEWVPPFSMHVDFKLRLGCKSRSILALYSKGKLVY